MSKADNKQLKEAIKRLEHIDRYYDCNNYYSKHDLDCIETALKELKRPQEDYISKDKIKEKTKEIQEEYELLLEHQNGQESNRTKYLRGKIHMGQELLEGK